MIFFGSREEMVFPLVRRWPQFRHGHVNDGFEAGGQGWTKTFTDPRHCAAIVDRLIFNGTIIETGTDSYRLATTRARAEQPAVTS